MLKVSVVIPVFNPGKYLKPCVESLTAQTLPAEEFEVIFVDDGSSDESPAYLDQVAAEHSNITVVHQENSGWPGQPRNVGIEAARGEYLFFCDHDDWFAADALARLHAFASKYGSDVVLPKMAGMGRPVPHHVFTKTVPRCSLDDARIMDSLTPHKLFRRAFLDEHRIRFPEGKRRLEDHLFVATAYVLADVVSIYADSTCYFHIRRGDSENAGFRKIDWPAYFGNLAEAIEVVEEHRAPGPDRDVVFRRWLQVEMVNRLTGRRLLRMDPAEASVLLASAHAVAAQHFGEGVVQRLAPASQRVARAILAGDAAALRRAAEDAAPWTAYARILQAGWSGPALEICGTVELSDRPIERWSPKDGTDAPAESTETPAAAETTRGAPPVPSREQRFLAAVPDATAGVIAGGFAGSVVRLDLTERESGARWSVPAVVHRSGLLASFTASINPDRLAGGARLADGLWDLYAHIGVLGIGDRCRACLAEERRPRAVSLGPVDQGGEPAVAAYFTRDTSGLSLDVGLTKHRKLRAKPKPTAQPKVPDQPRPTAAPLPRRALRKLRRLISG